MRYFIFVVILCLLLLGLSQHCGAQTTEDFLTVRGSFTSQLDFLAVDESTAPQFVSVNVEDDIDTYKEEDLVLEAKSDCKGEVCEKCKCPMDGRCVEKKCLPEQFVSIAANDFAAFDLAATAPTASDCATCATTHGTTYVAHRTGPVRRAFSRLRFLRPRNWFQGRFRGRCRSC